MTSPRRSISSEILPRQRLGVPTNRADCQFHIGREKRRPKERFGPEAEQADEASDASCAEVRATIRTKRLDVNTDVPRPPRQRGTVARPATAMSSGRGSRDDQDTTGHDPIIESYLASRAEFRRKIANSEEHAIRFSRPPPSTTRPSLRVENSAGIHAGSRRLREFGVLCHRKRNAWDGTPHRGTPQTPHCVRDRGGTQPTGPCSEHLCAQVRRVSQTVAPAGRH